MANVILGLLLVLIGFTALALQRLYSAIPPRELKRLSRRGDYLAQALYRPAAYGQGLRALLWLVAGVALAAGLWLAVLNLSGIAGLGLLVIVLLVALMWLPSLEPTELMLRFAAWASPVVVYVVRYADPLLRRAVRLISRWRSLSQHSRLYEKADLIELLTRQKSQPDNRILPADLELAKRALRFSDKQAADIARPRKQAHMVSASDAIGPILLDQLHKSGQAAFLVYKDDDNKDEIIGSLLMRDAVSAKQGGKVAKLIRNDLCYVHEDFSLRQVLTAFQKTGHYTAIVVNSFEEITGVITLNELLCELLGKTSGSSEQYESYESPSAVVVYGSSSRQKANTAKLGNITKSAELLSATSPEATGVVE